ncbi:MAG: YggT family protein [Treponema sp.]|jgi:YggT family protein|nr:YggT family protein [Treponema sp.]
MKTIFSLLSSVIAIYTILCFLRVMLTWFPRTTYSSFSRFLASVCDPYLNLFRRLTFLRINYVDFSPAAAIMVLIGISSFISGVAVGQRITIGLILAQLVAMCGTIVTSILGFLILLVIIRLIVQIFAPDSGFQLWYSLDQLLHPLFDRATSLYAGQGGRPNWTANLAIGLAGLLVINWACKLVLGILTRLLGSLPI